MTKEIDNSEDIIDSRDVIERHDELETERGDLVDTIEQLESLLAENDGDMSKVKADLADAKEALETWDNDYGVEFKNLADLIAEAEGYAEDWQHGATLIRDSYFEDYAQEFAADVYGRELQDSKWPFSCIDWERAARELQMDYTSVDFGSVTYWVR